MCGIFGCAARSDVAKRIVEGLRHLEYRGYDSAGIAVIMNGQLRVVRREGRIENLAADVDALSIHGNTGMGHTRWATHGPPVERNAHPHQDCTGDVAVIHNGIIENHELLRARLKGLGHRFSSDTDSEILPHLVEEHLKSGDLVSAVRRSLAEISGTYSFVVLDKRRPGVLVGGRKDSPLVVGRGEPDKGENFLASDVSALLPHTRDVAYLENGEVVEITPDAIRVLGADGAERSVVTHRIDWDVEAAAKGGYRHFMLKEIDEQPAVVAKTIQRHLATDGMSVRVEALDRLGLEPREIERITIVACGTSWHAGLVGKFLIEAATGLPVEVDYGSEFRYRDPVLAKRHLVLAISQSGETLDTLTAVRPVRERGAKLLSIVNVQGSSLARESDAAVLTDAGPEIGVASTKAFTTQLAALHMLALDLGRRVGRIVGAAAGARVERLRQLKVKLDETLLCSSAVKEAAERFARANDFLFLGRGINYPIALEGALKLKEISYIHAEGYPAGEMKHGPIALIDKNLPVVVLATRGRVFEKVVSNIQEVKARGGQVIAVADRESEEIAKLADLVLPVPAVDEELSPIVNAIPLQLLAYWIADLRGCDIDKPRNLAKSVTVE